MTIYYVQTTFTVEAEDEDDAFNVVDYACQNLVSSGGEISDFEVREVQEAP